MAPPEGYLLVVDDFELNRDMLTRRLTTRGFSVDGAENGRTALKMVEEGDYDIMLLDIMMPDLDGFEVLEAVREKFSSTDLAVIMVTAKDQSDDIVRALELGADDYVTKPIDFPVALARIRNQLKRRQTEFALRESEERYALAAKGANDGLWDWDLRSNRVYYSDRWKNMLGYEPDELENTIDVWFSRVHPDDKIRIEQEVEKHFSGKTSTFSVEYRMRMKDGSFRWLLSRGRAVEDGSQQPCRMVGWQTDSTDRVEHDSLTSLPGRGLFLDRISWALARCRRGRFDKFAVFYLGIDRFKVINESGGYVKGNQVLIQLARRVEGLLRPEDTLARLGGDEFTLLVEGIEGVGSATQIADRILDSVRMPFVIDNQDIHITVSIGVSMGDQDEREPEEILSMAQQALTSAKNSGKDCYEFFEEGMGEDMRTVLQKENYLRKAQENNELYLLYQPQIDTATGKIIGAEALLRWKSEQLGQVYPDKFIPLAEETGLIVPIGEWVLETACAQNKRWQDEGLPPIRVGVNISSRQFRHGNLPAVVERILRESSLDPAWLDLELTESMLIESLQQTVQELKRFHELGIHISLDDFGTGYSSLSYLKTLPIDTLKIDQSFVRDITTDPDDAAICNAIISMAHSLGVEVIAEGVETREHQQYLKELNCDQMQGYYFARPIPAEEFAELLRQNKVYD
ncbi:MAG: EAL domain-containing protein [Acidobacteriota bacterium]|nr:EAL domain-containing protein [Acidobacteriota bacterium]